MIDPETIIDGRYKVLSRLGSGGMAEVYLAEDQLLGRQLAVKVLHHHFAEDQEFVERFKREASSAAGLSHPNIVGIFDRGEWNGTYYIAMEYVAGRSLKTVVREQGALDPDTAIDIVTQILRAARFAHKRGVIHRDLKPHNVILDEEGRARVTDFGIARAGASDMTMTGSIMGTAQYLSPEQALGQSVTGQSDLYSLGVVLYELLTGAVPFDGETAVAIAFKQVSAEPRPPSALNPAIPVALDVIVLRALSKDPTRRYANAEEFIAALQQAREGLPASAGAGVLLAAPLPAGVRRPPDMPPALEPSAGPGERHPSEQAGDAGTDGPITGSGALLLPAAGRFDGDSGSPSGNRRRRMALRAIAGALLVALVVLVLLLLPPASRVRVPDVTGQTQAVALVRLKHAGLAPVTSTATSATAPAGVVIEQTPARGRMVGKGSRVSIVVSSGTAGSVLADVAGLTSAQALHRLRAQGFRPTLRTQPSDTVERGRVLSTDPPAGTRLPPSSPVTVRVSSGPAQVRVPDVTGQSQEAATAALTSAELKVGNVTQQPSSSQAPGTVLSQSPGGGASLPVGAAVNLVVAQAPKEVAVPGVVGQNETQAGAALGRAGFTPKTVSATTTDPTQVGVVLKQSPSAGHRAHRGATVTITVGVLGPQTTPTTTTPQPPPTTTTTTTTTSTPATGQPSK